MLLPCFVFGDGISITAFPPQLTAVLADLAAPTASSWLEQGFGSADLALTSATAFLFSRVADATPAGHPAQAARLSGLGDALLSRSMASGSPDGLVEAVDAYKAAVAACPAGDPGRASYLAGLGNCLRVRFEQAGELADLDEAARACQEAIELAHEGDPRRAMCLSNLGDRAADPVLCHWQPRRPGHGHPRLPRGIGGGTPW